MDIHALLSGLVGTTVKLKGLDPVSCYTCKILGLDASTISLLDIDNQNRITVRTSSVSAVIQNEHGVGKARFRLGKKSLQTVLVVGTAGTQISLY
jgi:uncharacterized membrane protein